MNYLDIASRLNEVIKVEAKDTSVAYFLATHKPFEKLKYVPVHLKEHEVDFMHEDTFFSQVFDRMDQHQFILVQGDNGSGKSHLIRWVKEKFEHSTEVDHEKETILFISRAQSTLRGALEQIINAQVFKETEMAEKLRKLVQANEHLSKEGLKQRIIHHFAIAVDEDDKNHEIQLNSRDRLQLYSFLVDQDTQHYLMGEDGPIERIQKKLASEARDEVMTEVNPRFEATDFHISLNQFQTLKKSDVGPRAIRFAESVTDSTNSLEQKGIISKRESYAAYINQFLDRVVEESTQFRGTDLTDTFKLLRQELKKQGKNLILLIEDITSFTGIDKALVDVLAYTHEGTEYDESFCRLISIVGVTNAYYDTAFPSNFKERVTARLFVDDAFSNVNDMTDMTARYLNALYVEPEKIEYWLADGAYTDKLPLSHIFSKHQWAEVNIGGHMMTLFPFNKRAIESFYSRKDLRTPRRFLQDVVLHYVHLLLVQGVEKFPPNYSMLSLDIPWNDSTDDAVLKRQVSDPELANRYISLFRVWGNRSLEEFSLEGKRYIGELSEDVFQSFGLQMLKGNTMPTSKISPPSGTKSGGDILNVTNGTASGGTGDSPTITGISKPTNPIAPEPQPINSRDAKFKSIELEIEKWMNGETLVSYGPLLGDLLDIIESSIHWEDEGIPSILVKDYLSVKRIQIEDQYGQVKVKLENTLIFHRNPTLRYALLALAAWRELGNKSWQFGSNGDYALFLFNWIEQEKPRILEFVRNPMSVSTQDLRMEEVTVASQLMITTLSGMLEWAAAGVTAEMLYMQITRLISEVKVDSSRDEAWKAMQNKVSQDAGKITENFIRYFNRTQGDIRTAASSKTFYMDAAEIIPVLRKMLTPDWSFDQLQLPIRNALSWFIASNGLHDVRGLILPAVKSEFSKANAFAISTHEFLGQDIQNVVLLFEEMKDMLNWLTNEHKESYDPKPFEWLKSSKCEPENIVHLLQLVASLPNLQGVCTQFMALAKDPISPLQPYHDTLKQFAILMDRVYDNYEIKKSNLNQQNNGADTVLAPTKVALQQFHNDLSLLATEVNYVAG